MFGLRKTLGSLLMVVAFLVLAALATFFYNADQEQKNELVNNNLVKKSGETLGALVGVSEKMTEVNVQKNIGMEKALAGFVGRVDWQALLTGTSTKPLNNEVENVENGEINNNETGTITTNPEESVTNTEGGNFWTKMRTAVADEWQKGREVETAPTETIDNPFGQGRLVYQKTNLGAEIIISSKTGTEYKLPLPFKFLNR